MKYGLLIFFLLADALGQTTQGTFRNLGPQISATLLQGSAFTTTKQGRELVCTVIRGQPAKLIVFDVKTGERLNILPLNKAEGAWNACAAADGSVYVGTDPDGYVFRYVPGEASVQELGQVPGDRWVWDVAPGDGNSVLLGTYPGCRVVRYEPTNGFKELSRGALAENENYARSIAYDPAHDKIYAGIGSHAHLIELDPKTGAKLDLLPSGHRSQEFVYSVRMAGDRLFAVVTNSQVGLVYNTQTRKFEKSLDQMPGQLVIAKYPRDERVFFVRDGKLSSYDPTKPDDGVKELMPCADVRAMTWRGDELVLFTRYATVVCYNMQTNKSTQLALKPPTEPAPIQSIHCGPDGRIWMGGYLSGGNAAFDPKTDKSVEYKGLSQSESITSLGDRLYFGLYPNGRFATCDTTKPWDARKDNPRIIGKIEGQSRPFGAIGVKDLNQVFWGTVPEYGLLGGGIAVYDVASDKLTFHHNVVPRQSVVSLAWNSGLLVGGTSIWGGLGIQPSEKSGKLFLWDTKTKQKIFETTPDEQAAAVFALINGPDGNVWGIAKNHLFIFNVAKRQIVLKTLLIDAPADPKQHLWRGPTLVVHPSGQIYGDKEGKLFRLDPETKKVTILRNADASLTAMDRDGRIYFRDRINLWQYLPPKE